VCEGGGQIMQAERVHRIQEDDELAQKRLAEVGIPPFDLVRLSREGEDRFVLLDRDRARVLLGSSGR
jgi:hypothetical protein